jgi:hypothetical protein
VAAISQEMQEQLIEEEIFSMPEPVQDFYFDRRKSGCTPVLAHMLAMQQAPMMGQSDRSFNEKARYRMANMDSVNRDKILGIAQRAGIRTEGKYYVGALGRYNDPAAWVSTTDDILDSAKKKPELTLHGAVKRKGVEGKPIPKKDMADDIAARYMTDIIKSEPKTQEALKKGVLKPQELRERVVAEHGTPSRPSV